MKSVFFTGASGGLGSLCVNALSATGRWLIFAGGTTYARLASLSKLANVVTVQIDVTSQDSVLAARELVKSHTDHLDAVANFAGLTAFNSMVEGACIDITEHLLDVNVMGTIRVNRLFFDLVYRGRGRIINCSSEAGWMKPQPFAAPYFLSKRALEAYNDSLRRELMYIGIPVIKIQPGSFDTHLPQMVFNMFNTTLQNTKFYTGLLTRMKPLMEWELNRKQDPMRLVKIVIKALESKHPRPNYRVGTGKLMALMNLLPDRFLDKIYRILYHRTQLKET